MVGLANFTETFTLENMRLVLNRLRHTLPKDEHAHNSLRMMTYVSKVYLAMTGLLEGPNRDLGKTLSSLEWLGENLDGGNIFISTATSSQGFVNGWDKIYTSIVSYARILRKFPDAPSEAFLLNMEYEESCAFNRFKKHCKVMSYSGWFAKHLNQDEIVEAPINNWAGKSGYPVRRLFPGGISHEGIIDIVRILTKE